MTNALTPAIDTTVILPVIREKPNGISVCEIYQAIRQQDKKYWVNLVATRAGKNEDLKWVLFGMLGGFADVAHVDEIGEGSRISERYWLQEKLGRGGTATVWRAFDEVLLRPVAIKLCTEPDERKRRRILQEARDSGQITHENVIRIYESREDSHLGIAWIAMELCAESEKREALEVGYNLATWIKDQKGTCEEKQAAKWTLDIAKGVEAAHQANIFSRDIKPGNVLIKPITKTAQVVDFGLSPINWNAKSASADEESAPQQSITMITGDNQIVVGTPAYMAPEQARGLPRLDCYDAKDKETLASMDQYGIGCCLYQMLTKMAPHDAGPGQPLEATLELAKANDVDWKRIPDSSRLKRIAKKAMATNPAKRYPSVKHLIRDLSDFLDNQPTSHEQLNLPLRAELALRRNPYSAVLGVINVLAGLVLIVLGLNINAARKELSMLRQQKDDAVIQALSAQESAKLANLLANALEEKAQQADANAKASEENAQQADKEAEYAKAEARRLNDATQQCVTQKLSVMTRLGAEQSTSAGLSAANQNLSAENARNIKLCTERVTQLERDLANSTPKATSSTPSQRLAQTPKVSPAPNVAQNPVKSPLSIENGNVADMTKTIERIMHGVNTDLSAESILKAAAANSPKRVTILDYLKQINMEETTQATGTQQSEPIVCQ